VIIDVGRRFGKALIDAERQSVFGPLCFVEQFPKMLSQLPYNVLLLHLGMNTTWYLHSHLV
jgi:hypothetical protein